MQIVSQALLFYQQKKWGFPNSMYVPSDLRFHNSQASEKVLRFQSLQALLPGGYHSLFGAWPMM